MNRVKLTIVDDSNRVICKIGTSVENKGREYTDAELASLLREMVEMLEASSYTVPDL